MEVIAEREAATRIDLDTIGDTWGRATSNPMKGLITPPREILTHLDFFDSLKERSILMCNYATKYFSDLNRHIQCLRQLVRSGFRGAYVVGTSRLSGIEIFTEVILASSLKQTGSKSRKLFCSERAGDASAFMRQRLSLQLRKPESTAA